MDHSKAGGHLTVTIIQANLVRDVETFGKMDPYAKLTYMGVRHKTKILDGAGKTPVWN
jgi:Ca2+-dependent lipid-binding protein